MPDKIFTALKRLFIIAVCLVFFAGPALANDIVKLKSGREIAGRLKEINDTDVILQIGAGSMWFRKTEVESINSLSVDEAQAKLGTLGAFMVKDKKEALIASAKEGINFVSKTRKLKFKSEPQVEITDVKKIREKAKANIEKSFNKEKLENRRKLLVKLGLISPTENYTKKVLDTVSETVAGYYDTDDKKIYINESALKGILPGMPNITVMHEQVHALQDQYHDLKSIEDKAALEDEDKGLALDSVIEGEATVLMYDAFFRSMQGFGMPGTQQGGLDLRSFVLDSMLSYSKHVKTQDGKPAVFLEDMLFPYVWGGGFIQHTVNTKGWEAVDAIYLDMPRSSEQIMHPEKYYIQRDNPKEVVLPDVSKILGPSWARLTKDVFGEFGFYLVGKVFLDELSNKMMTEGWGADAFEFYEQSSAQSTLLLSLSKWDSERDAEEFFSMYKTIIKKRYQALTVVKEDKDASQYKSAEGNIYIARSKDTVVFIDGAPDNLIAGLIAAFKI